jgi:hypothetical protein
MSGRSAETPGALKSKRNQAANPIKLDFETLNQWQQQDEGMTYDVIQRRFLLTTSALPKMTDTEPFHAVAAHSIRLVLHMLLLLLLLLLVPIPTKNNSNHVRRR